MIFYYLMRSGQHCWCSRTCLWPHEASPEAVILGLRGWYSGLRYSLVPESCVRKVLGRLPPNIHEAVVWPITCWPEKEFP
jgi:hypothetical protein